MAFDLAEVVTGSTSQLMNAVAALWTIRAAAIADFQDLFDAIKVRANLGDYGPQVTQAGLTGLVGLGNAYRAEIRRQLEPVFRNVLRLAGYSGQGEIVGQWGRIFRYLHENTVTFKPRDVTYGTTKDNTSGKGGSSAIVGDVGYYTLTEDKYGYPLDAGWGDVIFRARCVRDENNGAARFAEAIQIESDVTLSFFDRGPVGEGFEYLLRNDGGGILANPDFKIGNAANATPSALGAWLDDAGISGTAYELVTSPVYRKSQQELQTNQVALGLTWKVNRTLYQKIAKQLSREVPLLPIIRIYVPVGCDKRLRLLLGKTTLITQDLAAIDDDAYHILTPTMDKQLYLDNFKPIDGSDLKFQLILDNGGGAGVGTPTIDMADLLEGRQLNGRWVWFVSEDTPSVIDDYWEIEDEAGVDPGQIATVIQEGFGVHVPTSGTPSRADPV